MSESVDEIYWPKYFVCISFPNSIGFRQGSHNLSQINELYLSVDYVYNYYCVDFDVDFVVGIYSVGYYCCYFDYNYYCGYCFDLHFGMHFDLGFDFDTDFGIRSNFDFDLVTN